MERIEDLVELRDFLNKKTTAELERMSFEFQSVQWDDYGLPYDTDAQDISHITFDDGRLVCHPYKW